MTQKIPAELKYTKDHEWVKQNGDILIVGITDFAQSAMGDIVFVELPEVGKTLNAHQTFGVVESIKSVSDLFAPISGTIVEINSNLVTDIFFNIVKFSKYNFIALFIFNTYLTFIF
jgi:glycine cleavage system H protein